MASLFYDDLQHLAKNKELLHFLSKGFIMCGEPLIDGSFNLNIDLKYLK